MASPRHVIVCGAGVMGAAVAYYLTRRGAAVTVVERIGNRPGCRPGAFTFPRFRLLRHLVRAEEDGPREGEAQCSRRLEIDNQIEEGGLLDRKIGGFGTLEDAIDQVRDMRPVLPGPGAGLVSDLLFRAGEAGNAKGAMVSAGSRRSRSRSRLSPVEILPQSPRRHPAALRSLRQRGGRTPRRTRLVGSRQGVVEYAVGDHDVRACLVRDHPKRSADVLVGLVIVGSGTVPVVVE